MSATRCSGGAIEIEYVDGRVQQFGCNGYQIVDGVLELLLIQVGSDTTFQVLSSHPLVNIRSYQGV